MRTKVTKERRRIGRPPAGARAGEKVKDYPQLSIRLPGEVKAKLQALSLIASRPQWRIITEAIDCYLRERTDAERRMVDDLAGRARGRSSRGRRTSEI
jgi:predicted transcriptional regulator